MIKSNMHFIFVAIDHFSKWIETDLFFKIKIVNTIRFVKRNILYKFEVPKVLVMVNRSQFNSQAFKELCTKYSIKQRFVSRSYHRLMARQSQVTKQFFLI